MKAFDSPSPILLSLLNQYLFCQRRCALMGIEGIWEENTHTVLGTLLHEQIDTPGYEHDAQVVLLRALPLYSERYGLTGKADGVELCDGIPIPIEYKKSKRRRFSNDDVQLCAQGLCLEEMFGVSISHGYLYHAGSKRRRQVDFDSKLRDLTLQTITQVRALLESQQIPAAEEKPQCSECSLFETCLPHLTSKKSKLELGDYQEMLWKD